MGNQALYEERLARVTKAMGCEPVDQIPVIYMGVAFSPRYMGMSIAKFCEDPEAAANVTIAAMDRLNRFGGLDGCNAAQTVRITPALTTLWLSRIGVPGRDLPPDSLWQAREEEIMTHADYDTIIEKGWMAFFMEYAPKVIDIGELQEFFSWAHTMGGLLLQRYRDHGYVVIAGGAGSIPFEYLCGGRSMQQFYFDLYRMPDKVQATMDAAFPEIIDMTIGQAKVSGSPGVWVAGGRAASALLAPKLWNRFVWPYFVKFVYALVEAGLTPVLHWDQDWTRDLARLQELPAKKCVLNPDGMTDVRKFKEIMGDRMALLGDVPAALLAVGTPDDVHNYVRDLVRDIGPTGLLLCPGCDAPINAKPENMEAFVAAGHEFGKVKA
jgi:uroporphyrinogen-III decarboxylase